MKQALAFLLSVVAAVGWAQAPAQPALDYDLLIKGGHVIDPRNGIDAVRDVAVKDGRVAAVASSLDASKALKTVDASGLYVTPGLVDIHVHVYPGPKTNDYAGGDSSIYPDGFTLRSCVTTVTDAGSSGWRNFDDFKSRIVDQSKTRVTAFLNIVGNGMGSGPIEQNLADMDVQPTADMALKHKGLIVGIKSAHFNGPEWTPYEKAVEVGRLAKIPVMVDFGGNVKAGRTLDDLFGKYFRPGDIYTHMYGGVRGEQDPQTKGPSQAMIDGRKRGIIFDVGHGGSSFRWSTAVPLMKAGFIPDSISTDLHTTSMNAGMKDMLQCMSKLMALGSSLDDVVRMATVNPARQIKRPQLGNLDTGAEADVAVLRLDKGDFGLLDSAGARHPGKGLLAAEMTIRRGQVVWDLNGRAAQDWKSFSYRRRAVP